jgi:hypothetical protein
VRARERKGSMGTTHQKATAEMMRATLALLA